MLGEGRSFKLGAEAWDRLASGRWFARALDRDGGALLGAWSFEKTTAAHARVARIRDDELVAA